MNVKFGKKDFLQKCTQCMKYLEGPEEIDECVFNKDLKEVLKTLRNVDFLQKFRTNQGAR